MANNETEADKKPEMVEPKRESSGQNPQGYRHGVSNVGSRMEHVHCSKPSLIEAVVDRSNMWKALRRVKSNKGGTGIDGMTVEELPQWLSQHWVMIKEKLLDGSYQPQPVRAVDIPKPDGGVRTLGIPTVIDRLIQQAIAQVLNPILDPHFSETSYGFRAGKNAKQAVRKAQSYQHEGKRWVVDLDLEKFFDYVNHDILMQSLRARVKDTILLKLIGKYLRAGIMRNGLESQRQQGTPQGGPLSPLLSNILLDRFDKELSKRGHSHVRYADDCNIYLRSKRAAERVLTSISQWLAKHLRLKVNKTKSAVDSPWKRKFLGFSFTFHKKAKVRIAPQSVKTFKAKVKTEMRKGRGRNIGRFIRETLNPLLRGWVNYYRITECKGVIDELDSWIRRRLRNIIWRQWKHPRTRRKKLMSLGIHEAIASKTAYNGHGAWFNSALPPMNAGLPKKYFDQKMLLNLQNETRYAEQLALL